MSDAPKLSKGLAASRYHMVRAAIKGMGGGLLDDPYEMVRWLKLVYEGYAKYNSRHWMPFSTVPKEEGRWIVLRTNRGHDLICKYDGAGFVVVGAGDARVNQDITTHWMPYPHQPR